MWAIDYTDGWICTIIIQDCTGLAVVLKSLFSRAAHSLTDGLTLGHRLWLFGFWLWLLFLAGVGGGPWTVDHGL